MKDTHVYFSVGRIEQGVVLPVSQKDRNIHKYKFVSDQGLVFFNTNNDPHIKGKLFKLSNPL